MLILKYSRTGSAAYLPHLDVLRLFGRITRRARLQVRYSEGFNPHLQFWFGSPISLGIPSFCEYCAADSPEDAADFLRRFNEKSVPGLVLERARRTDRNPNFANLLCAAEYEFRAPSLGARADALRAVALRPDFVVRYEGTGREKTGADKLLSLSAADGDTLRASLRTGRENLKPDMWMNALLDALGLPRAYSLEKIRQYYERDGVLTDADMLFEPAEGTPSQTQPSV